jgi:SPP1 family predicted phage head-tail adaptor
MVDFRSFRHRITIERQTTEVDDSGHPLDEWSTLFEAWAQVKPLRGYEQLRGQQMEAHVTHRIHMWYRTGILPTDRILFDGRYFGITSIINTDEANKVLELLANEAVH